MQNAIIVRIVFNHISRIRQSTLEMKVPRKRIFIRFLVQRGSCLPLTLCIGIIYMSYTYNKDEELIFFVRYSDKCDFSSSSLIGKTNN